jgi:hypothetical protein
LTIYDENEIGKAIDIVPDLVVNLVAAFAFFFFGFHSFIYVYEHKNDTDLFELPVENFIR